MKNVIVIGIHDAEIGQILLREAYKTKTGTI